MVDFGGVRVPLARVPGGPLGGEGMAMSIAILDELVKVKAENMRFRAIARALIEEHDANRRALRNAMEEYALKKNGRPTVFEEGWTNPLYEELRRVMEGK